MSFCSGYVEFVDKDCAVNDIWDIVFDSSLDQYTTAATAELCCSMCDITPGEHCGNIKHVKEVFV